jgi:hypothetical protein
MAEKKKPTTKAAADIGAAAADIVDAIVPKKSPARKAATKKAASGA